MSLKKFWSDMHSNIHHNQMDELPMWFEHAKQTIDFWPIAYYPFYMKPTEWGLAVEDKIDDDKYKADWEVLRKFVKEKNAEGYPMFMGYEWQGAGKDGDHNVFFLDNEQPQLHPMRYQELIDAFKGINAIGIPHHVAYQLGSRGKNWCTHNEEFSPVAEIYSSHGSSESDLTPLEMGRHIHMGPRAGGTDYESGLSHGIKVGAIASGDNHIIPAIFEHGTMCALAKENTKECIWDALKKRHTYGVSRSRIGVDFSIDDAIMGDELPHTDSARLKIGVVGTNAIDRIEILRDNILEEMIVHSGSYEREAIPSTVRFKFRLEIGWGPDTRVYKEIYKKLWEGKLHTDGQILSVENCFNTFGQKIISRTQQDFEFNLTTYKSTGTGKWMGASGVTNEGFIFEIEADSNSDITLTLDGKDYVLRVCDIIKNTNVIPLFDEVRALTKETYGEVEHYRDDPWWHNAYKIKFHKGCVSKGYEVSYEKNINPIKGSNYRLRVWQKNGDIAWTSPIFVV